MIHSPEIFKYSINRRTYPLVHLMFSSEMSLNLLGLTSDLDSLHLPTVVRFPLSAGITTGGCRSLTYYDVFSLICYRFLLEWYRGAAGCLLGSIEKKISMQMQFT